MADELRPASDPGDGPDDPTDGGPDDPTCYCPVGGVLDLLARKYAIQVVCVVAALGPVRYGDIEAAFGDVSSSTLSARLAELTEAGLLERDQHDTIPPRVEYSLTEAGAELGERLQPLLDWVETREPAAGTPDA